MDITSNRDYRILVIKFNGITHLRLFIEEYIGHNTWFKCSSDRTFKEYYIQINTKCGTEIVLEYEKEEVWKEILNILDNKL